jgi:hypothetical protein
VFGLALGKWSLRARRLTLGKDSFTESLFVEWTTLSTTLGRVFTECFTVFSECP